MPCRKTISENNKFPKVPIENVPLGDFLFGKGGRKVHKSRSLMFAESFTSDRPGAVSNW